MKAVKTTLKLQLPAGKANPAPPVGTALGPHGLNIMEFCKQFNEATKEMGDSVIPVLVTVYEDRTFSLAYKKPPVSDMIKKALNLPKGAADPLRGKVGKLSREQVKKIAEAKMEDLNANDLEAAMKIVSGTARSMGVDVE
jgi:large subunit ribosomal protein L11